MTKKWKALSFAITITMSALLLAGCNDQDTAKDSASSAENHSLFSKSSASLNEETGELTLSGNVVLEDVRAYTDDDRVKTVTCKKNTVFPEDCKEMFKRFEADSIDISQADTSNVVNMSGMFSCCYYTTSINVSGIDTSKAKDMTHMFESCKSLESLDITSFNMENVRQISNMFNGCEKLTELDLSNFNCKNIGDTGFLFCSCALLTSLDLSAMDLSQVSSMSAMFMDCHSLKSINFGDSEIDNCHDFTLMFNKCSSLEVVDMTSFHIPYISFMPDMFSFCENLTTILVSQDWPYEHTDSVFNYCDKLVGGNGTKYDPEHIGSEYAHVDTPENPGYFTLVE